MSLTAEQSTKTLLAWQWLDCGAAEALKIGEIPWVAARVPAALESDLRSDETCSSVTSRVGLSRQQPRFRIARLPGHAPRRKGPDSIHLTGWAGPRSFLLHERQARPA